VIPAETNYLLNPLHPQFARIEIGEAEELVTDLRLHPKRDPAHPWGAPRAPIGDPETPPTAGSPAT
jgi:hypothetical protein